MLFPTRVQVTYEVQKSYALISVHFRLKVPPTAAEKKSHDESEFSRLEMALADAESALETEGTEVLDKAIAEGAKVHKSKLKQRPKSRVKLKRKAATLRQAVSDRSRSNGSKAQRIFAKFVKGARYVRGMGAASIHPSAKLRLFGLLMQAQNGDIPLCKDEGLSIDLTKISGFAALKGSALSLQRLKLKAWRGECGKAPKDAMVEYVEFLTAVAPQWRVAHILRSTASLRQVKTREMMWVLKIQFVERDDKSLRAATLSANSRGELQILASAVR